jgi:hypothetical protein
MWELAEHYRLSGDKAWFDQVKPKLIKAADWTIRQLDSTRKNDTNGDHELGWGLFPPAISSDLTQHLDNSAFNDAWIYRGLASIGAALRETNDSPTDADRITRRAEQYRQDIRAAWRRAIARCPRQALADGSTVPFVPGLLHLRDWRDTQGKNMGPGFLVFYLMDTGPLHLGQCGVFGAGDPEMEWALRLIRDGPASVRFLTHGVSTCEICFAPQFEYYLAVDDDPARAIEVFYSALAGSMDRGTFSGWEFRGGVQFCPCDVAEIVRQLRLMLIQERPDDELRLAAAVPRKWLEDTKKIEVREAPTRFGPISYRIESHVAQSRIEAEIFLPGRGRPRAARLRLRHPEGRPIRSVALDGKTYASFSGEWIDLPVSRPASAEPLRIVAGF